MTPEQKLKHLILYKISADSGEPLVEVTAENVDGLYDEADEEDIGEAAAELREGEHATGLTAPSSRYYEAKEVAAQAPDGSWIGWTYWYGGGKHGEPEAIDWMASAYALDCVAEEKMTTVRTFTKAAA